ncbi:MAG: hypothetical protein HOO96_34080 [Polyangiaceae bacterium]|nr:hypothetical protein [Polyangiaceae bacterium]
MNVRRLLAIAFTFTTLPVGLAAGMAAASCSSTPEEATPTRTPIPTANPTTDAGSDAPVSPECAGPDGCFKCEPKEPVEFLNACTDGNCIKFDNAARLPLYKAGEALPPVP